MRHWVRGTAFGAVLVTAGLMTGVAAVAAPENTIDPVSDDPAQSIGFLTPSDILPTPTDLDPEPTDEPTDPPIEEPTTEQPTDPPTEEPTDPPTEEPTDPPTEEPTEPPTEEPTEPPTEEPTTPPTQEPTAPPTDPGTGVFPEDPTFPVAPPVNQAPRITSIPPITAVSRADLTEADLLSGIVITDDVDHYLVPEITNWGDWYNPVECPSGYPCMYQLVYLVFDSHGNYDDATRNIIITGQQTGLMRSIISTASNNLIDNGVFDQGAGQDELPYTGVDAEQLFGISAVLIAGGIGSMYWGRRKAIR